MSNDNMQSQGSNPIPQPVAQVNPVVPPQTNLPPVSFYQPDGENASKGGRFKKIFKILLGLIVVTAFIVIFSLVILPKLTNIPFGGGQVTLSYWGLWEDARVMQGIISDFERENPNIKVEYSKQDVKQYRDRLLTRINNGTGPDIFRFHNTWYPMISDILLPLPDDTISKDEFTRIFYPVAQKDLIKNGAIYGIPLEVDTLSLFINNQLFQSAGLSRPVTWNDFINNARAMTVKDENGKIKTAGAAIGTYENVTHAPDILSLLFLQNGVDFKNIQGSSDRIQGALSFYTSFATDENNVWDNTLDPSILAFSKGSLGMFFGYSWDYFTIKQFNPNLSFQVVPVPQLPNQNVTLASYWAEGVSAKSKYQKEALLFMKFLAKKDTAAKLYAEQAKTRAFGEPYARVDLADTLKGNPDVYTFVSQAPDASSSIFVDSTYDEGLNQQVNTYLGNAVNSVISNGSVQTAFETFSEGITQILQRYGQ
ncbi:MAG: extracellular solute-binding protein [Patescibacteria group bacterium]|nr:extracellular solute-binding protein [Patescibacteria group bacterium]